MPLVNLGTILARTRSEGYAVGSFNFNGFEDVKGMIAAANELKSPIIVMASPNTARYIGVSALCGLMKGMGADSDAPVCLHLDHCSDVDFVGRCIAAGFTSVMIDASAEPFDINIRRTRDVVRAARDHGCGVEAELGTISGHEDGATSADARYTDPDDVPVFLAETGVDALAVAVGTVHGYYASAPDIDFDRIARIRALTATPLVLHGGTGVSDADFRRAIALGIGKINVGTELKYAYANSLVEAVRTLGVGADPRTYMAFVTRDAAAIARGKMETFGSAGRAA